MRVFQLNTFCGIKSTGRIVAQLAQMVERDGGACEIGYGAGTVTPEAARFAYRVGTPLERKAYSQLRKVLDWEGYGSFVGTQRLVREMERFQPDFIHLHNLHGCYLHLPVLFSYLKSLGKAVVWTLHDCWPFTGHCAYFDYAQCEKWTTGCFSCPQQRSYPTCYGLDGSRRNYAMKKKLFTSLPGLVFVTPCEWMKTPLKRSFLGDFPVRTIYNGVDLQTFHPVESGLRERYGLTGKKIVLSVASDWDERKGLRYLVEIQRALGDEYRLVAVGLSESQIRGLPKPMLGIAHTANTQELAAWYTAADCVANPTLEDNMPMVNLEALACGTPVAVFRTGGCPEAVDETCGKVVDKGDAVGLKDAVRLLCSQSEHMKPFCLAKASVFDSRRTFENYLELYKELCV